jgi:hypothetical protein
MSEDQPSIQWFDDDPLKTSSHFEGDSLQAAKGYLLLAFYAGKIEPCPCCGQGVKLYPRRIHKGMIGALVELRRKNAGLTSREMWIAGGGDYAKLEMWGLIDLDAKADLWHLTHRGRMFLDGAIVVPKHMYVYNSKRIGKSLATVAIGDIVEDFDLKELLDPGTVRATA